MKTAGSIQDRTQIKEQGDTPEEASLEPQVHLSEHCIDSGGAKPALLATNSLASNRMVGFSEPAGGTNSIKPPSLAVPSGEFRANRDLLANHVLHVPSKCKKFPS